MSTVAQNRQPPGRPTGGEYAPTVHAEPTVSLTVAKPRPTQLEGWPASLPEPDVNFRLNDDGSLTTQVLIGGDIVFEAWNGADNPFSTEAVAYRHEATSDDSVSDEAERWTVDKHEEMASSMRRELKAAFEVNRARVLAAATGRPQGALTDDELESFAHECFTASDKVVADGERASVALFARRVLAEYPAAHSATLSVIEHEDGTSYTGFTVYDEAGTSLGRNERDFGEEDGGVWDVAHNLETDSWTWDAFAPKTSHDGYGPSVDLRRAASWVPGTDPRTGEITR